MNALKVIKRISPDKIGKSLDNSGMINLKLHIHECTTGKYSSWISAT